MFLNATVTHNMIPCLFIIYPALAAYGLCLLHFFLRAPPPTPFPHPPPPPFPSTHNKAYKIKEKRRIKILVGNAVASITKISTITLVSSRQDLCHLISINRTNFKRWWSTFHSRKKVVTKEKYDCLILWMSFLNKESKLQ